MIRSPDDPIARSPDSISARSRLLLAGIITAAGADSQLLVGPGASIHVDGPEAADSLRSGRSVGNGVLVADVMGNTAADLVYFGKTWGKERDAPAAVRQNFERPFGLTRFLGS